MHKRIVIQAALAAALLAASGLSLAQDNKFKIGLILPMTGRSPRPASRSRPRPGCTWRRTATRSPARRSS